MREFIAERVKALVSAYSGNGEMAAASVRVKDFVDAPYTLRKLFPHGIMDFIGEADQNFPFYNDLPEHIELCQDFLVKYLPAYAKEMGLIWLGDWVVIPRGVVQHDAELHGEVHLKKLGYTTDINGQFVVVDFKGRRGLLAELGHLGCPMKVVEAPRLSKGVRAFVLLHKGAREKLLKTLNRGVYIYSPDTKELFDKFWK